MKRTPRREVTEGQSRSCALGTLISFPVARRFDEKCSLITSQRMQICDAKVRKAGKSLSGGGQRRRAACMREVNAKVKRFTSTHLKNRAER